ncbi:DMT family transporter [Piscinibacterium candidicorallinum]|uniref:DMT family transporter n=1 Tax=Piscinibacterium candidicorallinum TaxID=1793872 RepID=A0ABV7H4Y9_9BURK
MTQPSATPSTAPSPPPSAGLPSALLVWYFVLVWGAGFLATKIALQYTAPFTFLSLRYVFGMACVALWMAWVVYRPRPQAGGWRSIVWPTTPMAWLHVAVAGLGVHAVNLGGSHYSQYFGLSAGITALLLATQPLLTALIAKGFMHEQLRRDQWIGVVLGLAGVVLVVWHKLDARTMSLPALAAASVGLLGITLGALYQKRFAPQVDLRASSMIQFAASLIVLAPLALHFEGFAVRWSWPLVGAIVFLVIGASILAVNALYILMRRGQATRATSMIYLTPVVAVLAEWALFGLLPSGLSVLGMAITCAGVALVARPAR